MSLFCDQSLAERIERVETQLITKGSEASRARRGDTTGFVIPLAGGAASYAEPGSPLNKVVGLGFAGVPEMDGIERAYAEYDAPVQVELPHIGDPEIAAALTGAGYRLVSFENVLGLALGAEYPLVAPEGVTVRFARDDEESVWVDVVTDAFAQPDTQGVPSHEEFPRDVIANAMRDLTRAAGVRRYVALHDGVIAGGASMRMAEGVAQLTGAATAFEHRRRGVQTAMLSARLADAASAGCDLAVITTQPGSKSQENAQKRGFDLLYTRAILVRETFST
ncbi:GNAT family N-acetyltransferase [Kibdelosporangium lantanae]